MFDNPNNIYYGCLSNSDVISRDYDRSWDEQLDEKRALYESRGYKVVFVFNHNPLFDSAIAVLYDGKSHIPQIMQDYRAKYVHLNGHWVMECMLGICDKCGDYKVLPCLCNDGHICEDCMCDIGIWRKK